MSLQGAVVIKTDPVCSPTFVGRIANGINNESLGCSVTVVGTGVEYVNGPFRVNVNVITSAPVLRIMIDVSRCALHSSTRPRSRSVSLTDHCVRSMFAANHVASVSVHPAAVHGTRSAPV